MASNIWGLRGFKLCNFLNKTKYRDRGSWGGEIKNHDF